MKNLTKVLYILISTVMLISSCTVEDPGPAFTDLGSLRVKIDTPKHGDILIPGEPALFSGTVYGDTLLATTGLKVVWESSIDGILYEGQLDKQFKTSFETAGLSKNIHQISLKLYNEVDSLLEDNILVYNLIRLDTTNRTDHSMTLFWSKVNGDSVSGYELYRSNSEATLFENAPAFTTTNPNDTIFIDSTALIGKDTYYQVKVLFNNNTSVPSNIVYLRPGIFSDLDFPILKLQTDSQRNLIYGLVAPDDPSASLENGYGIVVLNAENLQVVKRLIADERFVDIAVSPDNNYLYGAASNRIYKIDLNTLTIASSFTVKLPIRGIEVGSNNRLFYHIEPGRYCNCDTEFRIVDLINEVELPFVTDIPAAYKDYYRGEFTIDPITNNIYHGNTLSSPTLTKFSTINDRFSNSISVGGWGFLTDYVVYNNGYVFWHHLMYDTNLNLAGTFKKDGNEETIMDVSPDGKYAVGWTGLFTVSNQAHSKSIPGLMSKVKFMNNSQLIIVANHYPNPTSIIYRYSY